MTLTALLNEVFVTLFADNKPFISAVTPGEYRLPQTYSLDFGPEAAGSEKCIFLIEDSQLDIGLLIAVERNINRILQIISDYLSWNKEMTERSLTPPKQDAKTESDVPETVAEALKQLEEDSEKKGFFARIASGFKSLFRRKNRGKKDSAEETGKKKKLTKEEKRQAKEAKKQERAAKKAAKKLKKKG